MEDQLLPRSVERLHAVRHQGPAQDVVVVAECRVRLDVYLALRGLAPALSSVLAAPGPGPGTLVTPPATPSTAAVPVVA